MEAKVDNVLFEAEKPEEEKLENEGKILYCSKCGFKARFNEKEVGLCPNCKAPLKVEGEGKLRILSGNLIGSRLVMRLRILGEGIRKAIPIEYFLKCRICGEEVKVNLMHEDWKSTLFQAFFKNDSWLKKEILANLTVRGCVNNKPHQWTFNTVKFLDYRFGTVEDLTGMEELSSNEAVVQGVPAILLKDFFMKNIEAECEVVRSPLNELWLIIYNGFPVDETAKPELTDRERSLIMKVFHGKSIRELKELLDRVIAPDVKMRHDAKLAAALTALSPMWLKVPGFEEPVGGCLRTLFYGDPRTGKGMILRWFWRNGLALHVYGEATSRTGLVWSIDSDLKLLRWGALPLADGRLCVIEGLHSLGEDEMTQLREALVQQRIEVHRMVSGSAWIRTRILADSNTASGSMLNSFLFKCSALRDSRCFRNPIDLTRWNIIIPFGSEDVDPDEMYSIVPSAPTEHVEAFKSLVRWAFSLKMDDIEISREAYEEAVRKYEALKEDYSIGEIPLIHNGTPLNFLRVAAAYAILRYDVENGKVKVKKGHVEDVVAWLREIYESWDLRRFKQYCEASDVDEESLKLIEGEISEDPDAEELEKILFEIGKKRTIQGEELAGVLGISYPTVKRRIKKLKEMNLVRRTAYGYSLTELGLKLLKTKILSELSELSDPRFSDSTKPPSKPKPKSEDQIAQIDQNFSTGKPKLLGFYKDEALCELCNAKVSSYNKVALNNRILIVCDKCFKELKDGNDAPADNYLKEEDDG